MSDTGLPGREAMEFDVVIVGAGPAGLAAAIRLKQLAPEISVVVVEKGSEVGAHILSGAVIDPVALDDLIPEWREAAAPVRTAVTADRFYLLGPSGALRVPNLLMPPLMSNHGNFIVSLGDVCRYLGQKAEALGVEIYPGFAAAEALLENGIVKGVATGDMGVAKDDHHKDSFTRGMELHAKYTLVAEGARGSLAKVLIERFVLQRDRQPQKFGIGLKELWEVTPENFRKGLVQHTAGWPLGNKTGGGSFLYHFADNLVAVGFVVHLNYDNPYLSPFEEFQRFKTHPLIRDTFAGGERICYGARALTEGGWQSVPKLTFPGGALIGCAAGFITCRASREATTPCSPACLRQSTLLQRLLPDARTTSFPITTRLGAAPLSAKISGECATPSRCGRRSEPLPVLRLARWICGPIRSAFHQSVPSSTASLISPR